MRYEKVYVKTVVQFDTDGKIEPKEIIWADGNRYRIDKVAYVDRTPSNVGGLMTWRYTVILGGFERKLYYEKDTQRWFIEKKI